MDTQRAQRQNLNRSLNEAPSPEPPAFRQAGNLREGSMSKHSMTVLTQRRHGYAKNAMIVT